VRELPGDLDLLLALDVLLSERHVTRAARRLGLTQSAMSQKLARLREYFGDPLLAPGRPLLSLTARAEAVQKPLARALADLRAAVTAGAQFDPKSSLRRFVILGSDLFESLALPALMPVLTRVAPRVDLVSDRVEPNFMERLEAGTADLALLPLAAAPPSLRHQLLPEGEFVVLMRKRHPASRAPLDLQRYLSFAHLLVAPRGMPGSVVDAALERLGRSRRVALRIAHFTPAPFIVQNSDLLLTVPQMVASFGAAHAALRVVPAPRELALGRDRIAMVWHERAHGDPAHLWLRTWLGEFTRQDSALLTPARRRGGVNHAW
jgi:DNA-binding transcriptional LysR family regulator